MFLCEVDRGESMPAERRATANSRDGLASVCDVERARSRKIPRVDIG